jgi:FAD dependent oxidoreductase TIGR03364
MKHFDLIIVGAGIMGLAHAYHANRGGMSVLVVDRSRHARGASIRNFGMLAVIAQSEGRQMNDALRALNIWQQIAPKAGVDIQRSGCLVLAKHPEEQAVLEEYTTLEDNASTCRFIKPSKLSQFASGVRSDKLLGGLWTENAWKVDQRQAVEKIATWLQTQGVCCLFSTEAELVAPPVVKTSNGTFSCNTAIVCAGDEFSTLFAESFKAAGVTQCELQMLRTHPQPPNWKLKPFILGGLSLPRYAAFAECPSMVDLKMMQQASYADYMNHGIHVIACQEADGSITIGDSHNYASDSTLDRSDEIDRLILKELTGSIALPEPRIDQRWRGRYAHLPDTEVVKLMPADNVWAVTMTNGQGMTHAFAIAEDVIRDITR